MADEFRARSLAALESTRGLRDDAIFTKHLLTLKWDSRRGFPCSQAESITAEFAEGRGGREV